MNKQHVLFIVFAMLYICGVNTFIMYVYRLSHKYGEHGLMKAIAKRSIPAVVKSYSRKIFTADWKQRNLSAKLLSCWDMNIHPIFAQRLKNLKVALPSDCD